MDSRRLEAGVDEVGRGCLAGPVVAAAVVWNPRVDHELINQIKDSKKLSAAKRSRLRHFIEEHAIATSVSFVSSAIVDAKNILQASFDAMHGALSGLSVNVDCILVDGPHFRKYGDVPHKCIVNGDNVFLSIAMASILAKVHRDHSMQLLHAERPMYGWCRNMGYGTAEHLRGIQRHGITREHRMSFRPVWLVYQASTRTRLQEDVE